MQGRAKWARGKTGGFRRRRERSAHRQSPPPWVACTWAMQLVLRIRGDFQVRREVAAGGVDAEPGVGERAADDAGVLRGAEANDDIGLAFARHG